LRPGLDYEAVDRHADARVVAREAAMTIPTRLRQRDILTAQLASCQRVDGSFSRGAVAALRWLTSGGLGPLTGAAAASIDFGGIVHELAAAEAIIYGPPSSGREYARGVEHALLWAEFATSAPPTAGADRGPSSSNERPSKSGSLDDGRSAGSAPPTWAHAAVLDVGEPVARSPMTGSRSRRTHA
jgi:uncharacterized membrane protein